MSKVHIFQTNITPSRNCIVDFLSYYLYEANRTYLNNTFQYIKIALDIEIKVVFDQDKLVNGSIGNYVRIQQDDPEHTYYYFIIGTEWISNDAVKLKLSMDTLNTFNGDFTWSSKTLINRQHMNRFKTGSVWSSGGTLTLNKIIDRVSENIQVNKYRDDDTTLNDTDSVYSSQNWYLIYRNPTSLTSNFPLEVVLLPKQSLTPYDDGYVSSITLTSNDLEENNYYYFMKSNNLNGEYYFDSESPTSLNFGIIIAKNNTQISAWRLQTTEADGHVVDVKVESIADYDSITFTDSSILKRLSYRTSDTDAIAGGFDVEIKTNQTSVKWLKTIDQVDRSLSNLVKIIELPYLPDDFSWSGNVLTLPTGWSINGSNEIVSTSTSKEFEREIYNTNINPILKLSESCGSSKATFAKKTKSSTREPKMLNSEITTFKYVYDSFGKDIPLEQISYVKDASMFINIDFKPSNTLASNLAFKFRFQNCTFDSAEDFGEFLLSNRNNEIGLLNSEYLNYMRTGFNYDVKAKNRAIIGSWLTTGLSAVGAIAAFASSAVTGGAGIAAGVGLATSTIASLAGSITTTINQESQLEQKLKELSVQSNSVSNINDVDLLNYYSNNKLHLMTYKPIAKIYDDIFDLFYYTGYVNNVDGIPDTNSRCWFNYVQCEAVFKNESSDATYYNYLEDIKQRFRLGVTYYHKYNNEYDWNQEYENWEKHILGD